MNTWSKVRSLVSGSWVQISGLIIFAFLFMAFFLNAAAAATAPKIAAGYFHIVAIKSDGKLWAWGYNYYGQLGDGTTTIQLSPEQTGTDNEWVSVADGNGCWIAGLMEQFLLA